MQHLIFNPIKNKFPRGAVKDNENIVFTLQIRHDFYFKKICLSMYDDFENEILNKEIEKIEDKNQYATYKVEVPPLKSGIYFYHFEIHFEDCIAYAKNNKLHAVFTKNRDEFPMWQLTVVDHEFKTPNWFKGTIMYQIFPDRFKRSSQYTPTEKAKNENERFIHENWLDLPHSSITHSHYRAKDFFMGNLLGIQEEKTYFKQLHIDSIYLNPIVESAENHRYSTADYFKVDSYFGTNEQFMDFCRDFKQEKIHIILDGVFSHTGSDSIYFNRNQHYDSVGAYNSQDSPYYDWFNFMEFPHTYHSWWGFDNLPTVNKNNDAFLKFVTQKDTGVINYWQQLGISGWRLDVADEFPDHFLDEIRTSAKTYDPDALIIGEVWEDASNKMAYHQRRRYFQGKQLDSVMNYPWRDAIIQFVKYGNAEQFEYEINTLVEHYPDEALNCLMNLLSSHDIPRLLTALAVDDAKNYPLEERPHYQLDRDAYYKVRDLSMFAAFIQFTLPGVPSIYYGDEIGMYGFTDPYNRLGFDREHIDEELLAFYQQLAAFRNNHKASFISGFEFISAQNDCIAYTRNDILCIVNMGNHPTVLEEFTSGDILLTNHDVVFTKYGIVVPKKTYVAIQLT